MAASGTTLTFADLKRGMMAKVVSISGDSDESKRLQEMGLTIGTSFKVVKVAPFGDPVEIDLRGYRLCLRKHETRNFKLQSVATDPA
jgi:ferrous iron transport protein A